MIKKITTFSLAIFLIVSCGKPNDPEDYTGGYEIVKKFQTAGYANDLVIDGNLCYITLGELGISILDISNPLNPVTISSLSDGARGYSTKIAKKGNAIYIAAGSLGVTVVNVEDPNNMTVPFSNLNIKTARNVHIMGDYLISCISEHGFNMTNIEDPVVPWIRATNQTNGYAKGLTSSADKQKVFIATGEMGMAIFDISNFEEGYGIYPLITELRLSGYSEDIEIDENKSVAFVACGSEGIKIVDYSNISNLNVVGELKTGGYGYELFYENNKIYMTTKSAGLQIIDVSNAADPKLVGTVDTNFALGITVKDNYIFVADEEEGLIVISKP